MLNLSTGAHPHGVTALALMSRQGGLITGGATGQMRTWRVGYDPKVKPRLVTRIHEHKNGIVALQTTRDEEELISASKDGSCIIWMVKRYKHGQKNKRE